MAAIESSGSPIEEESVERVLVVPRRALERAGLIADGFREGGIDALMEVIDREGDFIDRPRAERDSSWKQIIPYAVVRSGSLVFLFSRTKRGGESRLHELYSIGVGGHINPIDSGGPRIVARELLELGLRRELQEELRWEVEFEARPVGLLNDDSNDVGRVHFGVVWAVETPRPDVYVRETEILEGRFVGLDELGATVPAMETWSQLVARALFVR